MNNKNIFLHFLDRELLRSLGMKVDINKANKYVKILLLSTNSNLYINYSLIVEGDYLNNKEHFIPLALKQNKLTLIAEEFSFDEFILTRQEMYLFDYKRYPMYFKEQNIKKLENYLKSNVYCNYDDIENLSKYIYDWSSSNNDILKNFLYQQDIKKLNYIKQDLKTILDERENEALILSFFENKLKNKSYLKNIKFSISRMLTALYINDFLKFSNSYIATGITGISYFDILNNNFPYNDIPIIENILYKIGLFKFIKYNNIKTNKVILQLIMHKNYIYIKKLLKEIINLLSIQIPNSIYIYDKREKIINKIQRIRRYNLSSFSNINDMLYNILENLHKIKADLINTDVFVQKNDIYLEKNIKNYYDFFISHASEEQNFVDKLVTKLENYNLKIWYDKNKIDSGDSLIEKINTGLLQTKYGAIIILSRNYFDKNWCQEELKLILNMKINNNFIILPIYYKISYEYVIDNNIFFNDILPIYYKTNVENIAKKIYDRYKDFK